MSVRIFVGNLSYETRANELEELFGEFGDVREVFLPTDRATGRPRGFAIVEVDGDNALERAIEALDEKEVHGRAIRVSEARARSPKPSFGGGGGHGGGGGRGGGPPKGKKGSNKGSRRGLRGRVRSL